MYYVWWLFLTKYNMSNEFIYENDDNDTYVLKPDSEIILVGLQAYMVHVLEYKYKWNIIQN